MLPTIKSDSIYPLPNDVAIFNINIVDIIFLIGILVPFTPLGTAIGLAPIALKYIFMIFGVTFLYCIVASYAKKIYIKKYKEWI